MAKIIDDTNLGYFISKIKASFWPKADVVQISIDESPTQNSTNLVTSGGVYTAVDAKYTKPASGIPASDLASGVIPTIPVEDVTVGGTSVVSNGTAVIPAIPSISGLEETTNKVTSLSSSSTDTQYPSAKCIYDIVGDIETLINAL